MKRGISFIILLLLLALPMASATTGLEHWFNNTLVGTGNTWLLQGGDAPLYTTGFDGLPNTAILFNSTIRYISDTAYSAIGAGEDYFNELVFMCPNGATDRNVQRFDQGTTANIMIGMLANGSISAYTRQGGNFVNAISASTYEDSDYHYVVTQRDASLSKIETYIDGVLIENQTIASTGAMSFTAALMYLGYTSSTADECAITYLRIADNELLDNDTIQERNNYFNNIADNITHSYCYQEQANESNACGGIAGSNAYTATGTWTTGHPNVYDADYATYGQGATSVLSAVIFRYQKPPQYFNNPVWQVKGADGITQNFTISDECYNYYDDYIQLYFRPNGVICTAGSGTCVSTWGCYMDGFSTINLLLSGSEANRTNYLRGYEEGMYWQFFNMTPNVTYSGNITKNGTNYVAELNYTATVACSDLSYSTIERYINGSLDDTYNVSCTNDYQNISFTYNPTNDGLFNITLIFNSDASINYSNMMFGSDIFYADSEPPVITTNITNFFGFTTQSTTNVSMTCTDNALVYNITYYFVMNNNELYNNNLTNNTILTNNTAVVQGNNYLYGACSDALHTTTLNKTFNATLATLFLIDEVTNNAFNTSNLSSVILYLDDNSTQYDFKTEGNTSNTTFTNINSTADNQLRLELLYPDGAIITRYVDLSLVPYLSNVRLCTNKDTVRHFEQIIISSTERAIRIISPYANCTIGTDYTRFAYQEGLLLRVFTIDRSYYLYTYDNDLFDYLAGIDGGIASVIQLDSLIFNAQGYDIDILGSAINFRRSPTLDNTLEIYFTNNKNDFTSAAITITREDTHASVYSATETSYPNNFSILFSYASLSNITNLTLFKITVIGTTADGTTSTLTRYMNIGGQSGILPVGVAVVISVFLVLFGMTFAASRITFSWFGLIIMLLAMITLTLCVPEWYVTFLAGIEMIIFVFAVIVMVKQNNATLA